MANANQVCCARELVLAYHAYNRSLREFMRAASVTTLTAEQLAAVNEFCHHNDPRAVEAHAVSQIVVQIQKG